MKKIEYVILVAILLLVGGFYALNAYIYNEKQADAPSIEETFIPGES